MLIPTSPRVSAHATRLPRLLFVQRLVLLTFVLSMLLPSSQPALAQSEPFAALDLAAQLVSRETQLIHLINQERALVGAPPVRWNRELSEAARWFAKDRVDGPEPGCTHRDSVGDPPGARIRRFGYPGALFFGEVMVCGYSEPENSLFLWMTNPNNDYGARTMLLDPTYREIGVAYYQNPVTNRGFVVANFASDANYAPVIINGEAPTTSTPEVSLYIYPTSTPPAAIKVSSDPTFADAEWQPYAAEMNWTLPAGSGWRSVYVLTREGSGKMSLASDMIWLGDQVPISALSLDQASSIGIGYAMDALPPSSAESVRFSLGWELDNDDGSIMVYRGAAEQIIDESAVGGSALRMRAGERETLARALMKDIPKGRILTAYFRVRTDAPSSSEGVISLRVLAGGRTYGPVAVRAADFRSVDTWQEFGVNFVLEAEPASTTDSQEDQALQHGQVEFQWEHDGKHTVWIDSVRVYSQPLPNRGRVVWAMEPGSERNMGVQARFDGSAGLGEPFDIAYNAIDSIAPIDQGVASIEAKPGALVFESMHGNVAMQGQLVLVCDAWCGSVEWRAQTQSPWLQYVKGREGLLIFVAPSGLTKGAYQGMITFSPVVDGAKSAEGDLWLPIVDRPGAGTDLLQTWVDVQLLVDGAAGIPPREVVSISWLPLTQK